MVLQIHDLLFSGAEARVYRGTFHGKECIAKERFEKKYRLTKLDTQLRAKRTVGEAKALAKCRRAGVLTPCVYHCDMKSMTLWMEYVPSRPLRQVIEETADARALQGLAEQVGRIVAAIHNIDIVHGDLTTSNLLVDDNGVCAAFSVCFAVFVCSYWHRTKTQRIYAIDFGLAQQSTLVEDHAVDLYVLERAIEVSATQQHT